MPGLGYAYVVILQRNILLAVEDANTKNPGETNRGKREVRMTMRYSDTEIEKS